MKVESPDYIRGLKDGVTMYAWWKDGRQNVGTCGATLKKALEDIDKEFQTESYLENQERYIPGNQLPNNKEMHND